MRGINDVYFGKWERQHLFPLSENSCCPSWVSFSLFWLYFEFWILFFNYFVPFLMSNWILLFLTNLVFIQSLCPLRLYPSSQAFPVVGFWGFVVFGSIKASEKSCLLHSGGGPLCCVQKPVKEAMRTRYITRYFSIALHLPERQPMFMNM